MSDEQPRAEWIFAEPKKKSTGRVWLIVALIVAALAIASVLLFVLIPRDGSPTATPSPSASQTETPTVSPSPSVSPTPSAPAETEPPMTQTPSPPPAPAPDLKEFTADVQPRLDDAVEGLDLVENNIEVGSEIVDSLQRDAEQLSGIAAPSSLADDWTSAVKDYSGKLNELRAALDNGSDPQEALKASSASLETLRGLIDL